MKILCESTSANVVSSDVRNMTTHFCTCMLTFLFVAFSVLPSLSPAEARIIEKKGGEKVQQYCNPFYIGVKKIYLSHEAETPYAEEADWKKILGLLSKQGAKILENENVEFVTNDGPDSMIIQDEDGIYVTIFYSFGKASDFSIPIPEDHLATWARVSRPHKDEHGNISINTRQTKTKFYPLPYSTRPSPRDLILDFNVAPFGLVENVACDVLENNTDQMCTNRRMFSENKIVTKDEPCIRDSRKQNR